MSTQGNARKTYEISTGIGPKRKAQWFEGRDMAEALAHARSCGVDTSEDVSVRIVSDEEVTQYLNFIEDQINSTRNFT